MALNFKRIREPQDKLFRQMWDIYIDSFPKNERRSLDYQQQTMLNDAFHCEAILEGDELIGILWWWSFDGVRFIEHLATRSDVRGGGYGAKILNEFIARDQSVIILEVEHPECQLSRRRIGFYERLGFHLNAHHYSHPSYWQDGTRVELLIMSHPCTISQEWLTEFQNKHFASIHFRD